MTSLFFYGTLRHLPLLHCVLGRDASLDCHQDVLPDYAAFFSPDGLHPVLQPVPGAQTSGLLVTGLRSEDVHRLNFYEAGFDFEVVEVELISGARAMVYVPGEDVAYLDTIWDYTTWETKWARMNLFAAQEVMAAYGHRTPQDIAALFPRIRARAWSKVLAQSRKSVPGIFDRHVDILDQQRVYSDFFAVDDFKLRHETFDGEMSDTLDRATYLATDAAIVLPYDPVRDRVLLVEQFRMGPLGRQDPVRWQLEPVAGLIDPGETPQEAARREGMEEAGLTFHTLETVSECYSSPGVSTEFYHIFAGVCDLPDDAAGIGGEISEGENIRSHLIEFDTLYAMAEAQKLANAPLVLLTYWLAVHRARLRNVATSNTA